MHQAFVYQAFSYLALSYQVFAYQAFSYMVLSYQAFAYQAFAYQAFSYPSRQDPDPVKQVPDQAGQKSTDSIGSGFSSLYFAISRLIQKVLLFFLYQSDVITSLCRILKVLSLFFFKINRQIHFKHNFHIYQKKLIQNMLIIFIRSVCLFQ